jgi:tetratricopeptide (TPR) repeat protein
MKPADPWAKLAAAYDLIDDQQSRDKLLERRPAAVAGLGDLYAADHDGERAIVGYRKAITDQKTDAALLAKLATAYQEAGRTREAVPVLASKLANDSKDTPLLLKVAALQAWFGQNDELAVTCTRALDFAKDTQVPSTAERTAKICSLRPSSDRTQIDAALALARRSVELGRGSGYLPWFQMALGMAEYRSGHLAEAEAALEAAADNAKLSKDLGAEYVSSVSDTSAFYRAIGLFRQGKKVEAKKLATEAAAKMVPLPRNELNPLSGGADYNDLILWLAYKEAKSIIEFDAAPPPKAEDDKK